MSRGCALSLIDRRIRLADGGGSLGLECSLAGLSLAGAPLLKSTVNGFEPRPIDELSGLLKSAYGEGVALPDLFDGIDVVARALSRGDLGRAMVAALRLRLPELDWRAAIRIARHQDALAKRDVSEELRDWLGRWTTGGNTAGARPKTTKPSRPPVKAVGHSAVEQAQVRAALQSLYPKFSAKFDDLGPEQFADAVTKFGTWIGQQAKDGRAFDRIAARAEYDFLQDRLQFWIGYNELSQDSHAHMLSAEQTLYTNAQTSGLVDGRHWPRAMTAVAFANALGEGGNPSVGMSRIRNGATAEGYVAVPTKSPPFSVAELPASRNLREGVGWGRGIEGQGKPWEESIAAQMPTGGKPLPPGAETWDHFVEEDGIAVSAKTLDTTTYTYASKPERIYAKLSAYIDAAATYGSRPVRRRLAVPPEKIKSREIQLAVPYNTANDQWPQIYRAIVYGRTRGVRLVVTRLR